MTTYNSQNGGAAALAIAMKTFTGMPYTFGGVPPKPTDCSGVVQYSYGQIGVKLPRNTYGQYVDEQIPASTPSEPGDCLFIPGSDAIGIMPGHVMLYHSPGVVFQAEETGTKIGLFSYNTSKFEYRTRPALFLPAPPPPVTLPPAAGVPSEDDLKIAKVVGLNSPAQAQLALRNGWRLYYWSKTHFVAQVNGLPTHVTLYANVGYKKPLK